MIANGVVVDDQPSFRAERWSQNPDPVGLSGCDGIGLFQQQGSWLELGQWPEAHQNVAIQRWIVEGLTLVVETGAELLSQAR